MEGKKQRVHKVLAHSYSLYFVFFLAGVVLDLISPIKIFRDSVVIPIGLAILVLGSALILWSQKSSRVLDKENLSKDTFRKGPYRFVKNPTHWGLFLLLLGFGMTVNAIYVVIFTLVYFIVDHLVFLKKQDNILEEKYGEHFREYKKSVKIKF